MDYEDSESSMLWQWRAFSSLVLITILGFGVTDLAAASVDDHTLVSNDRLLISTDIDLSHTQGGSIVLAAPVIIVAEGVTLRAGHGARGVDARGIGVPAIAGDGAPGGDIILVADHVVFLGWVVPGDGGAGGDAAAWGPAAFAKGGAGGSPGRVVGVPSGRIAISSGGAGGNASAYGDAGIGCGGDAPETVVRGEPGSHLAAATNASSFAGDGADACLLGEDGGRGGDAYAFGGDAGGDGTTAGPAGWAEAKAGRGGDAFQDCGPVGGDGGAGGHAVAMGGNSTSPVSVMSPSGGSAVAEGGSGGKGGPGQPPGKGGALGDADATGGSVLGTSVGPAGGGGTASSIGGIQGANGEECGSALSISGGDGWIAFLVLAALSAAWRWRQG